MKTKLADLIGLGADLARPVEAVGGALDSLFTSDEERLDKQTILEHIRNSPYMASLQLAMIQAQQEDPWTKRARPMVLYAFCLVFVIDRGLLPGLFWLLQIFHSAEIPPPPSLLDSGLIMTVVTGVIGLGTVVSRGVEKVMGAAR
ncbi:MAG: 3TM-type holin [Alphaproteobacteria bacterium]